MKVLEYQFIMKPHFASSHHSAKASCSVFSCCTSCKEWNSILWKTIIPSMMNLVLFWLLFSSSLTFVSFSAKEASIFFYLILRALENFLRISMWVWAYLVIVGCVCLFPVNISPAIWSLPSCLCFLIWKGPKGGVTLGCLHMGLPWSTGTKDGSRVQTTYEMVNWMNGRNTHKHTLAASRVKQAHENPCIIPMRFSAKYYFFQMQFLLSLTYG